MPLLCLAVTTSYMYIYDYYITFWLSEFLELSKAVSPKLVGVGIDNICYFWHLTCQNVRATEKVHIFTWGGGGGGGSKTSNYKILEGQTPQLRAGTLAASIF